MKYVWILALSTQPALAMDLGSALKQNFPHLEGRPAMDAVEATAANSLGLTLEGAVGLGLFKVKPAKLPTNATLRLFEASGKNDYSRQIRLKRNLDRAEVIGAKTLGAALIISSGVRLALLTLRREAPIVPLYGLADSLNKSLSDGSSEGETQAPVPEGK